VPADREAQPVRRFGTFTPDLHALADWLAQCGVKTVAMESTGVYWIPIYEELETAGLRGSTWSTPGTSNGRGARAMSRLSVDSALHSYGC